MTAQRKQGKQTIQSLQMDKKQMDGQQQMEHLKQTTTAPRYSPIFQFKPEKKILATNMKFKR